MKWVAKKMPATTVRAKPVLSNLMRSGMAVRNAKGSKKRTAKMDLQAAIDNGGASDPYLIRMGLTAILKSPTANIQ